MIYVPDPATRPDLLFLPRDYATSGQPGRVMVWYQNRVYQAFSLRDGALVETVYPAVKLSIAVTPLAEGFRKGGSGSTPSRAIRLSVSGTAGQTVELQYSANLTSPSWNALATLTLGASGHGEYVDADAFAGGATSRLYRAVNR